MKSPLIDIVRSILAEWSMDDNGHNTRRFTTSDLFAAISKSNPEVARKYLDTLVVQMTRRGELVVVGNKCGLGVKMASTYRVDRHELRRRMMSEETILARQMEAANLLDQCFRAMRGNGVAA